MSLLILTAISVVPGLIWVWYFANFDRRREPVGMLAVTFLAGTLSVIPAAILEMPLRGLLTGPVGINFVTLAALGAIGLIEEGVKLVATYLAAFRSAHFDEPTDGIIYAITAALGFAAIENLFYTATFGVNVAIVRGIITSLAHASFAGIYGFWLGLYKMGRIEFRAVWRGLLLAAALHGLYNLVVMSRLISPVFAVALVYGIYRYVVDKLREVTV